MAAPPVKLSWHHAVLAFCIQQGALLLYLFQMEGWAPVRRTASLARAHAAQVVALERFLHVGVESSLSSAAPAYVANEAYLWVHIAVLLAFVPLCWLLAPQLLYRATLALGAAALVCGVCAALYPLAPPRLTAGFPNGLLLTGVAGSGQSWDAYSAFPSYHCIQACAVLSVALWADRGRVASPGARFLAYSYVILIVGLVLVSANHWVVDVLGAAVVWGLCCVAAGYMLDAGDWLAAALSRFLARRAPRGAVAPDIEPSVFRRVV